METKDTFKSIIEKIQDSANVKTVFGVPVEAHNRTVIPVTRIAYGFGGGTGSGPAGKGDGFGLGGLISVKPIGVLEISEGGTRFITLKKEHNNICWLWPDVLKVLAETTYTGFRLIHEMVLKKNEN